MSRLIFALAVALSLGTSCASSGLGSAARSDITARMQSAQPQIVTCYEQALKRNRELRGTMVVKFATEPKTGQFTGVEVVRSDLADPGLQECVTKQVASLKLEKPPSTRLSIEYPFEFTPKD